MTREERRDRVAAATVGRLPASVDNAHVTGPGIARALGAHDVPVVAVLDDPSLYRVLDGVGVPYPETRWLAETSVGTAIAELGLPLKPARKREFVGPSGRTSFRPTPNPSSETSSRSERSERGHPTQQKRGSMPSPRFEPPEDGRAHSVRALRLPCSNRVGAVSSPLATLADSEYAASPI
ncbi:hypothetical protein ACFQL0_02510 [Haloplanus litoreus]|uniref:hypothetical protein n=1 Tax=Haloplanus litoreus TaxID=767515 RepID=UPI00361A2A52